MSGGVATALTDAIEGADDPVDAATFVQAALFEPEEIGDTSAPSPLSAALPAGRRGRPPGSKNRRTEAVSAWLLSQHRHPLSVMMEAYSMTPTELAARIGVHANSDNLLDLFKLQVRMAEAVAPYVASKAPVTVKADVKGGVQISFEGVSLPARGGVSEIPGGDDDVIDGVFSLSLPTKSDDEGRTGD